MGSNRLFMLVVLATAFLGSACSSSLPSAQQQNWNIKNLIRPVQKSVATVITYDLDGDISTIGSGFFIATSGILVTNYHVLDGAYRAEIKTVDGRRYPIATVIAKNQLVDLIKVRVQIPSSRVSPIDLFHQEPAVADRVVVIGSPMGLEQTVSEGIISAIREMPAGGKVFQLTAPISPGSSGGPALNQYGEVIGVVTFQASRGQNLNFAISVNALEQLSNEPTDLSITEWTIRNSKQGPALAASLCSSGTRLTIQGEYEEALTYFKKAAEANPDDPVAWYGLGSCYVGLDQPDEAIEAYKQPIAANPDNTDAHFVLAMYYKTMGQYQQAVSSLLEVTRIDPTHLQAQFELGQVYGKLERFEEQITSFQKILERQPTHVPTLLGMGVTLGKIGRYDKALGLLNEAATLEPNNALIQFNLGVTYHLMNQPAREIRAYTRAIHANPRMVAAHYNLADAFLLQGNRKLALDEYEILKILNPDAADQLFEKIYPPQRID